MPNSLRAQAYGAIKDAIITGRFKPGERLLINELASHYEMSTTPIREALKSLETEDLVDAIPRVGYFVSQISLADINDLFELREILECECIELATQRITEEEIEYLEHMTGGYEVGDIEGYRAFLSVNREFHYYIAKTTGNLYLAEFIGTVLDKMQRILFLRLSLSSGIKGGVTDHSEMIAAFRARDGKKAKELMQKDIERAWQGLLRSNKRRKYSVSAFGRRDDLIEEER